jgi:hypothetical protein
MTLTRLLHALARPLRKSRPGTPPARRPSARLEVEGLETRLVPVCSLPVNQCFLTQAYPDVLNRPVDPSGLSGWSQALVQGFTRPQVALALTTSAEFRTLAVQGAYNVFLHRAPDPNGLSSFVAFLAVGGSIEQMDAIIIGSLEYSLQGTNSSAHGFLNALYMDVLGRPVDTAADAAFTQQLASGVSRSTVALTVLTSLERASNLVQSYYRQFLHRAADSAGLNLWVAALINGARQEQVIALFVGSDEYLTRP